MGDIMLQIYFLEYFRKEKKKSGEKETEDNVLHENGKKTNWASPRDSGLCTDVGEASL